MNFFKKFNKLNFKDKNKNKRLISLATTIFGIGLIITGTSAAYLISEYEGKTHTITAASLVLSLPTESNGITLSGALPVSDEVGLASEDSYSFTLKNTGELKMDYAIYLKNRCVVGTPVKIDNSSVTPDICVPNEYIKLALKTGDGEYEIVPLNEDGTLVKGILEPNDNMNFEIKLWLSEDTPNDYQGIQNGVSKNVIYYGQLALKGQQYSEEGITDDDVYFKENLDQSGANPPVLAKNMIPVYYDGENWLKADKNNKDENNKWYDYNNKMWANAVTVTAVDGTRDDLVDAPVGTTIPMERINTMMVWIPRFSATKNGEYNGATEFTCSSSSYTTQSTCESAGYIWRTLNPGAFNITFVNKDTAAHDAFDFGGAVTGFWIGKFENSSDTSCTPANNSAVGTGCNLTSIRPKVLPNATSWRGAMGSTFFYNILAMTENGNQYGFDKTKETTLDTHMLKNNEWGAVAYLSQSIYGRCTSSTSCTEVGINNNSSFVTGYGAPVGSDPSETNGTYETTLGMDASTTGNIYGVYDMSGGAYENVMGVYWDGTKKWSSGLTSADSNSGFNGCLGSLCSCTLQTGVPYPSDDKYYNLYTTSANYTSSGLQHALTETSGWYSDSANSNFVNSSNPWFLRGDFYNDFSNAGVFSFGSYYGNVNAYFGSRFSAVIN